MWRDLQELMAVFFIVENLAFFAFGVVYVIKRFSNAQEREKEALERLKEVGESESQRELADVRNELSDLRELMANMVLELDEERRVAAKANRESLDSGGNGA